jgi:hypothetical protein
MDVFDIIPYIITSEWHPIIVKSNLIFILSFITGTYTEADLEGGVRGARPPKIRKAYVIQR